MTPNKTKLPVLQTNRKAEEAFEALVTKGIPLYVSYGLTKQHLEALYETGYNLYAEKKYIKALGVFSNMTLLNHFDKRGWMGSAACHQLLQQYEDAITSYSYASRIDIQDPLPIFRTIECYIALKKYDEILSALEVIKPLVKDNPKFVHLKNAVNKIEKLFEKNK